MGAHKAFLWARSLAKANVYMVSTVGAVLGRELKIHPVKSLGEALSQIQPKYSKAPRVAVFPKANSTYVRVR